jgi:hypothetical protein
MLSNELSSRTVIHESLQTETENPERLILNEWSIILYCQFSVVPTLT